MRDHFLEIRAVPSPTERSFPQGPTSFFWESLLPQKALPRALSPQVLQNSDTSSLNLGSFVKSGVPCEQSTAAAAQTRCQELGRETDLLGADLVAVNLPVEEIQ